MHIVQQEGDKLIERRPGDTLRVGDPPMQYNFQITEIWSDEQLNAIGLYRVVPVEPPDGEVMTGYHFEMHDGKVIQVITTEPAPQPPPPHTPIISDRQFFQALALMDMITKDEALAAVRTGEIPLPMMPVVDAIQDPVQKFGTKMLLSGATQFERHHALVTKFGTAFGMSADQIDDLWQLAASL